MVVISMTLFSGGMVRYVFLKDMIGYRKEYYIRETGKTFKDR